MADQAATRPASRTTSVGVLSRRQTWWPGSRRRRESGRLALAELDISTLDERIDELLEVLAQMCDYSGQPEVAEEFRAGEPAPAAPVLRLVPGQR